MFPAVFSSPSAHGGDVGSSRTFPVLVLGGFRVVKLGLWLAATSTGSGRRVGVRARAAQRAVSCPEGSAQLSASCS